MPRRSCLDLRGAAAPSIAPYPPPPAHQGGSYVNFLYAHQTVRRRECSDPSRGRHAGDLASFGKKALIVTGRHSAFSNGSYEDTTTALENAGIGHVLFSEVEENPSVATIMKARDFGLANSVDFVIGIGGGS